MSALVLGVGNILLSDEGVGVRVVEALEKHYQMHDGVTVMDGGTAGMELLEAMAGREFVLLVDAVNTGAAPGTRVRLEGEAVPTLFRGKISPHQLGISDLLAALQFLEQPPRDLVLLGVVPACLDTGLMLSPQVHEQVPDLVREVVDVLADRGWSLTRRSAETAATLN